MQWNLVCRAAVIETVKPDSIRSALFVLFVRFGREGASISNSMELVS